MGMLVGLIVGATVGDRVVGLTVLLEDQTPSFVLAAARYRPVESEVMLW